MRLKKKRKKQCRTKWTAWYHFSKKHENIYTFIDLNVQRLSGWIPRSWVAGAWKTERQGLCLPAQTLWLLCHVKAPPAPEDRAITLLFPMTRHPHWLLMTTRSHHPARREGLPFPRRRKMSAYMKLEERDTKGEAAFSLPVGLTLFEGWHPTRGQGSASGPESGHRLWFWSPFFPEFPLACQK